MLWQAHVGRAAFDLEQTLGSVVPLGAASEVPGYEYFTGGTSFLARRRRVLFATTAAHALADKPDEDVWIPPNADSLERLPLRYVTGTQAALSGYELAADLAAFRVEERFVRDALAPAVDLDRMALLDGSKAVPGGEIVFAGFPKGLVNAIDYETRCVSRQRFVGHGRYVESRARWLHRFEVGDLGRVETLDGMSGSPVFYRGPGEDDYCFAGVLVRGDAGVQVAHFVEAHVLWWLLDRAVRRDRNAAKRERRAR
jgi:hypothetical protein